MSSLRFTRLIAALLIAFPAQQAIAQAAAACPANPCGVTLTGSMGMNAAATMALSGAISGNTTTLTPPTAASFQTGYQDSNGPILTVRSNTAVSVGLSSSASTWQRNGGATTKSASHLQWSTTGAAPFTPVTTATSVLSTGAPTSGQSQTLTYRVQYQFTLDVPGTWTLPLVFTMVSP